MIIGRVGVGDVAADWSPVANNWVGNNPGSIGQEMVMVIDNGSLFNVNFAGHDPN
jgi:hypothetical protein